MTTRNDDKHGRYLKLHGKEEPLLQHTTDFTVIGKAENVKKEFAQFNTNIKQIATNITRVSIEDKGLGTKSHSTVVNFFLSLFRRVVRLLFAQSLDKKRDELMDYVRKSESKYVAHHVYKFQDADEEVIIDDRILLTLSPDSIDELEKIKQEYHLEDAGRMGDAYILRVTAETKLNPLKTANKIAERKGVESCNPHIHIPLQGVHAPELVGDAVLFKKQWQLDSTQAPHPELAADAGINVKEAWSKFGFGSPKIVIAIIDDGFDFTHPTLQGKNIDPHQKNFVDDNSDTSPKGQNCHGTPVASLATGSRSGGAIIGVAPDCTLLPIRVNLGAGFSIGQIELLKIFEHASAHADVVNCSFTSQPTEKNRLLPEFVKPMTKLTVSGGRNKRGIVIVFGAGNDDAPTNLKGADNKNGVWFVENASRKPKQIPPGKDVNTEFPLICGVVVVGAVTSLKRKAAYSNWGEKLTIMAPSDNGHEIAAKALDGVNDEIKAKFNRNYPGLNVVAANNRQGQGSNFPRLEDDMSTSNVQESHYTEKFGGTSGAAPIVTGVVALMLSVKPELSAKQVIEILKSTADKETVLDFKLDLEDDPNLQGDFSGDFVGGRSRLFGAGKVNAFKAVKEASITVPEPPVIG